MAGSSCRIITRFSVVLAGAVIVLLLASGGGCSMISMPGHSHKGELPPLSSDQAKLRDRLRDHVEILAAEIGERNMLHYSRLQQARNYTVDRMQECGLAVHEETYTVTGREVANIVAEVKGRVHPKEIVVIGAHYDSPPGSPGANDNASGVAALLELARMFRGAQPARTIRFVAFVNEEPPWFQSEQMGSLVYARQAKMRGERIVGMLSLETIGYYSEKPHSQLYPAPFSLFYPDTGDFIAFVSDFSSRSLLRGTIGAFRATNPFPSEGVASPRTITGIGWSDHWSFWQEGYPAVMVTDTAPFRYPHYHQGGDTPEKLDYERMARVVQGMERVVGALGK